MIEGLRCLPFFHTAQSKDPQNAENKSLADCERCKMRNNKTTRRHMGCAYEAPHPRAQPWSTVGMRGKLPTVCAGYTTALPEVIEMSHARAFMEKGALAQWSDEPITEHTREALMILAVACNDDQSHEISERTKPAGAR